MNKIERIKMRMDQTQAKLLVFQTVLAGIKFENRSKYQLEVTYNSPDTVALLVNRPLIDTHSGKETIIGNSIALRSTISESDFVKAVFCQVGQFEAHEFAETFKYNDRHAFFPHNHHDKAFALYGQGEALNQRLLRVWNDVSDNSSDWRIAMRHLDLWFVALPVVSHYLGLVNFCERRFYAYCHNMKFWLELKRVELKQWLDSFNAKPEPQLSIQIQADASQIEAAIEQMQKLMQTETKKD